MYLPNATPIDNVSHVLLSNPAPGNDRNSSVALLDKSTEIFRTLQRRRRAARRENAIDAEVYELLERFVRVDYKIECPVKSHRQPASEFHEPPHLSDFDTAVGRERSGYDPMNTESFCMRDVMAHCLDLRRRINEITGARSNEDEDGNPNTRDHGLDQP